MVLEQAPIGGLSSSHFNAELDRSCRYTMLVVCDNERDFTKLNWW